MEHRMQSPQPPLTVLPPYGSQNLQGDYWPGAHKLQWEQNEALLTILHFITISSPHQLTASIVNKITIAIYFHFSANE